MANSVLFDKSIAFLNVLSLNNAKYMDGDRYIDRGRGGGTLMIKTGSKICL